MKSIRIAFFLLLSLVVSVRAADMRGLDAELRKTWPKNRTINIVCHGHSVPAGYHRTPLVKPFESYPHLFRVMLNERYPNAVVNVITTAVGGENAVGGAARFKADVLTHKPDLIFIDYGLNDRKVPMEKVEAAWRSMIHDAKEAGVPVVLVTPTGAADADLTNTSDPLSRCADLIRRLAASEDVLLSDVSKAWLAELAKGSPQAKLLSQPNHPNLQGNLIAGKTLFATVVAATGG